MLKMDTPLNAGFHSPFVFVTRVKKKKKATYHIHVSDSALCRRVWLGVVSLEFQDLILKNGKLKKQTQIRIPV